MQDIYRTSSVGASDSEELTAMKSLVEFQLSCGEDVDEKIRIIKSSAFVWM